MPLIRTEQYLSTELGQQTAAMVDTVDASNLYSTYTAGGIEVPVSHQPDPYQELNFN